MLAGITTTAIGAAAMSASAIPIVTPAPTNHGPSRRLADHAEHHTGDQPASGDARHQQAGSRLAPPEFVDRERHDEHLAGPRDGERQRGHERYRAHIASGDIACASGGLGERVPQTGCGGQLDEICDVHPHSDCRDEGAERERRRGRERDVGVVPARISPPQTGPTRTPMLSDETECSVGPDEVLGPPRHRRKQCRGRRPDEEGGDALRDGNCDEDGHRREECRRDGRNSQCDEAQREHRCEDAFTRDTGR